MSSDTKLIRAARETIAGIVETSHGTLTVEITQEQGKRRTYTIRNQAGAAVLNTDSIRDLSNYWAGLTMGIQIGRLIL